MRSVSIVGIGQIPIKRRLASGLRELGAAVVKTAMEDAGVDRVDALYASNMLADELQCQKHLASLIADEAGLRHIEALEVRAASAAGAAALRVAGLAVACGSVDLAVAVGVEIMSSGVATPVLSKALDAEREVQDGATLISQNALLMQLYFDRYHPPQDALAHFSVNAHANAKYNPFALYSDRQYTVEEVMSSRLINPPIRLLDCSPICDGAAAIVLAPTAHARAYCENPVRVASSSVSIDRFRLAMRPDPLANEAARESASRALRQSGLELADVDLFELHDAFSIMACLSLESVGFAKPGEGWRLAAEGEIGPMGKIPVATMGGLKARGHPIGASGLYQTCEVVLQLTGRAGRNQVPNAEIAMTQSVGGPGSTIITHIFAA